MAIKFVRQRDIGGFEIVKDGSRIGYIIETDDREAYLMWVGSRALTRKSKTYSSVDAAKYSVVRHWERYHGDTVRSGAGQVPAKREVK
jgi:hypothetical protein